MPTKLTPIGQTTDVTAGGPEGVEPATMVDLTEPTPPPFPHNIHNLLSLDLQ